MTPEDAHAMLDAGAAWCRCILGWFMLAQGWSENIIQEIP